MPIKPLPSPDATDAVPDDLRHPSIWRDAAVVVAVALVAAWASIRFELSEHLAAWTYSGEHYQLDELPGILFFVTLALLWFAQRRHGAARNALAQRQALQARLAVSLEENRALAQQTLAGQETERKHLARELHDELGQYLNAIKIDAVRLHNDAQPAQATALAAILRNTDHVYGVINHLIRRLRPAGLDDLGLPAALESCIDDWRARLPGAVFRLEIEGDVERLDEVQSLTVYRIVQEGLTNAARHGAPQRVTARLRRDGNMLAVSVEDDGRGVPGSAGTGLGLIGMRERAQALGGELVAGHREGGGFRLAVRLPVTDEADDARRLA